jgi:Flp pilus assembly protein TadG
VNIRKISLRRRMSRGQSLVEMALILPILLGLSGGAVDFSRAYQAWLSIESASRNAAEQIATGNWDSTTAPAEARRIVCEETQNVPGFVRGTGPNPIDTCTSPVTTVTVTTSTASPGSTKNPIATAHVTVTLQFQTLVPWPLLPRGATTMSSDRTYTIIRGRS